MQIQNRNRDGYLARDYYEKFGSVPPIRKSDKCIDQTHR